MLRDLNVAFCTLLDGAIVATVLHNALNLKRLNLFYCTRIDNDARHLLWRRRPDIYTPQPLARAMAPSCLARSEPTDHRAPVL
jgi:hypothetical protein